MTGPQDSPWLRPVRSSAGPSARRLIFFPPAGSSASAAWPLAAAVPADWSVLGVQYPARGPRLAEPPSCSIGEMAQACIPAVIGAAGRTVLFGHSFGSLVAYEVAQRLEAADSMAAGLLVASSSAPGSANYPDDLSDQALIRFLTDRDGTPPELLADEELMRLALPALRSDLSLGRDYVDDHQRRLMTAIAALGGRHDRAVSAEHLGSWRNMTDAWLGYELGDGGHFFFARDSSVLTGILRRHWPVGACP